MIAFLKIITGVSISRKLEKYKSHPGLNARLKNYSVKLGFGLHLGWAIEVDHITKNLGRYWIKL